MYNRWYNPIKHICIEDFKKINGLGLAIWYMDDGSKCKDGGGIISTNCFSLEELEQVKNERKKHSKKINYEKRI